MEAMVLMSDSGTARVISGGSQVPAVGLLSAALIYLSISWELLRCITFTGLRGTFAMTPPSDFLLSEDPSSRVIWDLRHHSFCHQFSSSSGFCSGAADCAIRPIGQLKLSLDIDLVD